MLSNLLAQAVVAVRDVIPYLGGGFYKTYDYMLRVMQGLIRGVYNGQVGGDFVDAVASLIRGQINQAFQQAYEDMGYTFMMPDYLQSGAASMIATQTNFDWIYSFYQDIVDARVDGTPLQPLLARASMWANVYLEAYNEAMRLIVLNTGGNLIWREGDTKEKCATCQYLDGKVASAKEWEIAGFKPQGDMLQCGGFNCGCSLSPTTQRRSPNALEKILSAPR
jgi:hypothetical protein